MKRILQIPLIVAAAVCLLAGGALAIPLGPEYQSLNVDTYGAPNYTAGSDLGYYIWTDDAERTSWHIRWSGNGPDTYFTGSILLEGNVFDEVVEISFDNHGGFLNPADWSFSTPQASTYFAIANVGQDGLDFTISNLVSPSYVGFDLFMNFRQNIGENIFIGADMTTVASLGSDGDFKVAAPVPEPASMFLMGAGLAGFAAVRRRRRRRRRI